MLLLLHELREKPRRFDHSERLPDLVDQDGRAFAPEPARLQGIAGPGAAGVELHARLETRLSLCCSRCLEPFPWELGQDVDLTLVSEEAEPGEAEEEMLAEDAAAYHAPGGRVELGAIIREQIHLNLPLKAVCAAGCRGLCPSCGANRNRLECACRPAGIDPRLAPLARLGNAMAAEPQPPDLPRGARRGRGK